MVSMIRKWLWGFLCFSLSVPAVLQCDEVSSLKERVSKLESKAVTPLKNARFKLGGELEFEFVDTQNDDGIGEPDPHFKIDQLYLYPKVTLGRNNSVTLSADIAITPAGALLEECWARFSGIPGNTWLEAGLNDLFMANISRKTETEILIESAFYRDDEMGIKLGGAPVNWFYWRFSATNGFDLATQNPSEDNSYRIIHDDRYVSNANKNLSLGVGMGLKGDLKRFGKIDLLGFYYDAELSPADTTFLMAIPGYDTSTSTNKVRYGGNLRYDIGAFTLIGQYMIGADGTLDRTGWFVQPSCKFTRPGRDIFNAFEVVYRYSNLNDDIADTTASSLTWDRQQHVIGLITDIYKNVKLKTEYIINDESTGGAAVDNNDLLMQLEIKF